LRIETLDLLQVRHTACSSCAGVDFFNCPERNNSLAEEAILADREVVLKRIADHLALHRSTTEYVMSAFLTAIYHQFCKARLAEMRQVAGY
jgi:hypothetical protein